MNNNDIARTIYAAAFGEAAAKRNAQRIAKLADLVGSYGSDITLREIPYGWSGEESDLRRQYEGFVLGNTSTNSRGAGKMVIAIAADEDVQHDGVQATHHA